MNDVLCIIAGCKRQATWFSGSQATQLCDECARRIGVRPTPVPATPAPTRPEPTKPRANGDDELCAKCSFTFAGHVGNTGNLYPCWTPSGRYKTVAAVPQAEWKAAPPVPEDREEATLEAAVREYLAAFDSWNSSIADDDSTTGKRRADRLREADRNLRAALPADHGHTEGPNG